MNDFVKIEFFSESIVKDLLSLNCIVKTPLEEETGLIHFPKYAEYKNLRFKISESNRVEITGSLHKYYKGENFSDFTYYELWECIKDLSEKLHFNPFEARLHNLEFGVNVSTLFNPYEFCGRVIAYKNESFTRFRTSGKTSLKIGFEMTKQWYDIKIYDKGKQYLKSENILRFEVKANKMEFLKSIGIYFLSDLLNTSKLIELGKILNEVFAELIILEEVKTSELSMNENKIYATCINPKEWERFTPKERHLKKKQFNEILRAKGKTHWKETTAQLISDKWGMLMAMNNPKSRDVLTDLPKSEKGCFNRLDISLIHSLTSSNEKRVCKSCGRDISNQKTGSVFCSEKIFGKEVKECRNKESNPRNNFINREKKMYGGLNLFEVNQFLK